MPLVSPILIPVKLADNNIYPLRFSLMLFRFYLYSYDKKINYYIQLARIGWINALF